SCAASARGLLSRGGTPPSRRTPPVRPCRLLFLLTAASRVLARVLAWILLWRWRRRRVLYWRRWVLPTTTRIASPRRCITRILVASHLIHLSVLPRYPNTQTMSIMAIIHPMK